MRRSTSSSVFSMLLIDTICAVAGDADGDDSLLTPTTASSALHVATAVLLLLLLVCLLVFVYVQPAWVMDLVVRHSHPSVLWCAATSANVCALTIDDAPSAATPQILDLLRRHNIKATFFVISNQIKGNEDVVRRIVDEGHRLGNHLTEDRASILDELHVFEQKIKECDAVIGAYQPHHEATQSTASATRRRTSHEPENSEEEDDDEQDGQYSHDEEQDADATVTTRLLATSVTKVASYGATTTTKWLRPASGWFTGTMREIVASHGYRICMGSVYPHDAQIKSERVNALFLKARTRPGSVIIVHDRAWTVGVLRDALPTLVRKFTFVSLDELTHHHHHHGNRSKRDA